MRSILPIATAVYVFLFAAAGADADEASPKAAVRRSGPWLCVDSPNFRCWSQLPESDARLLANSCELWRERIRKTWITAPDANVWTPKCEVVIHPHQSGYNRTLNRPGDTSVGSTRMDFDQGRTVSRRIDVRADAVDWSNAALPHELTHVVLGERFGGRPLPRWADEGIAMLSESEEKHRVRLANLRDVLATPSTHSMEQLLQLEGMPKPHLIHAFYGQSLAVSSLLIRKSTPARFADFVEDCDRLGVEASLRKHYQLNGIAGLQSEWDRWIKHPADVAFVKLAIQIPDDPTFATAAAP
jgi:hypothetical protein